MVLLAIGSAAHAASSQQAPPIRNLGPIIATSSDSMQSPVYLRALPNGNVLVAEYVRRRVLLFDSTLTHLSVVVDSGVAAASPGLIAFGRDSTLFVDLASTAMLVIDDEGKIARTISVPKTADRYLIAGGAYGVPVIDANGRLIYVGGYRATPGVSEYGPAVAARLSVAPDSSPLVRADFETRAVDTIGVLRTMQAFKAKSATLDTATRHMIFKDTYNPLAANDEWVGLSDGSIAIVRAHDYHVDFLDQNGHVRSGAKLPFDWHRLSDTEKQAMVDSQWPALAKFAAQTLAAQIAIATNTGLRRQAREIEPLPLAEIPDYAPPFYMRTATADLDGNVWILPRMSVSVAAAGLLYDVVNHDGQLVERVRLPAGRTLAGFGLRGTVLLTSGFGGSTHIEVVRIR